MLCGGSCATTFYCNTRCQAKNWTQHRALCVGAKTEKGRENDDEEEEVEPVVQKKKVVAWRDFTDTRNNAEIAAWRRIVDFLNLRDLKNLRLADRKLAEAARNKLFNDYWVQMPEDPRELEIFLATDNVSILIKNVTDVDEDHLDILLADPDIALKGVVFDNFFDQPVDNLPPTLQSLTFGESFDRPVDNLPPKLQSLTLGFDFDQPVDNLPHTLQSLTFGFKFRQPVNNLPPTLQNLVFGVYFNQPVDNLPSTLQSLTFGERFNQPVDKLPPTLQSLTFGKRFNQPVDNLPRSLRVLQLRSESQRELFVPEQLENVTVNIVR